MDINELYRLSRRTALLGMVAGLALGIAKLGGGLLGHSVGLVSDAVHSLGDALLSAIVLGALVLSQRPPDSEHPYGHTRAEAVAGSNISLLLVLSSFAVAWEAIRTWNDVRHEPEEYTLWIAAGSAAFKEALYRYNSRVASRTGSSALQATAWDHRLDAFTSLVVVGGIVLTWWGPAWSWADHAAALGVAAVILWVGGSLFWNSLQELMDRQADPQLLEQVRHDALDVPGVQGIEKLLARKSGLEYLVDIHVEVDPELTVRDSHGIAHAVKDHLLARNVSVKNVLVHIEPAPTHALRSTGDGRQAARG